jgi:hypothetical protein
MFPVRASPGTQLGRKVAHAALQGRLDGPHGVVTLHHLVCAVVAPGEQAPSGAHQGLGELRHPDEGVTGDVHGREKPRKRAVDHAPLQVVLGHIGDRMNEEVQPAPLVADGPEEGIHLVGLLDIERHKDLGVQISGQGLDELSRFFGLVGDGLGGPQRLEPNGTAVGDAFFVCDPNHETLLPCEIPAILQHGAPLFHGIITFSPVPVLQAPPRSRQCVWPRRHIAPRA